MPSARRSISVGYGSCSELTRNKIGRLKQRMESGLGDECHVEWFKLTDIIPRNQRGGPVGMGVVVHCSIAKHVRTLDLSGPEGEDAAAWAGRIFPLQLSREGCPHTWQVVGVYQHVAAESRSQMLIPVRMSWIR